jgi:hypothetical protein
MLISRTPIKPVSNSVPVFKVHHFFAGSQSCPEERLLELFVQQFSLAYNFSTDQHFERLFLMLLKNRFMNRCVFV